MTAVLVVYLATCETSSFTFTAVGASESAARAAMRIGLRKHAQAKGLSATWHREQDFNVARMVGDVCYRDGGPL